MNRFLLTSLWLFSTLFLVAQNQVPQIDNLQVTASASELTINYDLTDPDNQAVEIILRVSDNGATYDINTVGAIGDIGYPVSPGMGKSITWDFSNELSMSGQYRIMLVADDREVIDIQEIVDQVDSNRLRDDLSEIVGVRHRTANRAHLEKVRILLKQRFEDAGVETNTQRFSWNNFQAENIIGARVGVSDEKTVYIVDGHYDSVSNSPGADDNGSAVAGMLEVLRVLAPYNFKKTVKYIGFDLEEVGLVGSGFFVNMGGIAQNENIGGVFNLEMIGYYDNSPGSQTFPTGFSLLYPEAYNAVSSDGFRGNFITNVGIASHPEINEAFESAADQYVPELKVISILAPDQWLVLTPDLGRSDHAPFWLAGYPALMITDGSNFRNPFYHTPNDKLETINFTFMSQVIKATVAALAEEAEITHSSTAIADVNIVTSAQGLADRGVTLFPNPMVDRLSIDLDGCLSEKAEMQLITITGEVVLSRQLDPSMDRIDIPTTGMAAGTYLLVIRSGGAAFHEKLILSR